MTGNMVNKKMKYLLLQNIGNWQPPNITRKYDKPYHFHIPIVLTCLTVHKQMNYLIHVYQNFGIWQIPNVPQKQMHNSGNMHHVYT